MITGNEPAMPTQGNSASGELEGGLTIRQEFAKAAMQGILASWEISNSVYFDPAYCAKMAVEYSVALIKELNKTES